MGLGGGLHLGPHSIKAYEINTKPTNSVELDIEMSRYELIFFKTKNYLIKCVYEFFSGEDINRDEVSCHTEQSKANL